MTKINEALLKALPPQEHQYFHTYFHISSGYIWGMGISEDKGIQFYDEMKALFTKAGWTVEEPRSSSGCLQVHKGGNCLYCHPIELSGPCERELLPEVEQLLKKAKTCRLRFYKTYDQIYDLTDEQYRTALDTVRKDIEQDLLNAFKTRRRDLFYTRYYSNTDVVADRYRILTLARHLGISSDDVHTKYVYNVFRNLVKEGKILCRENPEGGKMYRTATGPERLELDRKQAASLDTKIQNAQDRVQESAGKGSAPSLEKGPPAGRK